MAAAPLQPGTALGSGYEVIAHLSRGRRLDVYDAWSFERGSRCVLKSLRPERSGEREPRELLVEEGRLLAELAHPHLVRAYETFLEPVPTVVLETLAGETLAYMIESDRRPTAGEAGQMTLQLGAALRYLHGKGILHLDLKPANVVAEAGRTKLFDLSVARAPGPAPAGIGTPDYMAPEQARGGEPLGPAADVWGLGVVLYELLTGERAFGLDDEDDSESWTDESWTDESWTDEDESWHQRDETGSTSGSGAGDEGDVRYLQLEGRAPLLGDRDDVERPLGRLVDDCLEPEAARRPSLAEVLARAESIAGVPAEQARWGSRPEPSPTDVEGAAAPRSGG